MINDDGKKQNNMKQDNNDPETVGQQTVDQEAIEQHNFDLLSQYVDGELSQQQALQVKQRLLSEPELNAQFRELQAFQENVRSVIPGFENEPMNDKLASLLALDSNESNDKVQYLAVNSDWKFNLSLAASIMLVAVIGIFVLNSNDQSQTGLQFQDTLFSSLESNQSWSSNDGLELMIVQSYLDESDALCREYFARDAEHSEHGISCFNSGSWDKQVFELKFSQSSGHYVTASANDEGGVEAFLKSKSLKTLSSEEELKELKSTN